MSARDLPSVVEMLAQLEGLRLLAGSDPDMHAELEVLNETLERIVGTVDGFYSVLGSRNWIYHESLSMNLGERISAESPDGAEQLLLGHYRDPAELRSMIRQASTHPALKIRLHQIELAKSDFEAGRFYSTVLLLLSVMDGFVNEVDPKRRKGLHAREADEMVAWNSVAGHHLGLSSAHSTFTKGFYKTSTEEVSELFRNGIVHGALTNFDNETVAAKAWNRLFAVLDWARSSEKARQPDEPAPTWNDLENQQKENERVKFELEAWAPSRVRVGETGFTSHPIYEAAGHFLSAWRAENFGAMAGLLSRNSLSYDASVGKAAGSLRSEFEPMPLDEFKIIELDFQAAAICEIEALLTCGGKTTPAWLRWIREGEAGDTAVSEADGSWKVMVWGPWAFFNRRESEDESSGDGFDD